MSKLKTLLLLFTFLSLASCDPVRLRREQNTSPSSDALTTGDLFTTTDSPSIGQQGQGFEHCGSAAAAVAANLGTIKACQNSTDPTNIRIQLGSEVSQGNTCIIPLYRGQAGSVPLSTLQAANSTCFAHQPQKVMVGVIRGDNPRYFGTSPNSIMIIKQSQLNSFFQCANATQNQNSICTQFKNNHKDINYLTYLF